MRYFVSFELETTIDVEDGHGLTDDEVREALIRAVKDDLRDGQWSEGSFHVGEGSFAEPDYAIRVSKREIGMLSVVDFELAE